jgi:type I restriction enzyme, R subunit
MTAPPVQGPHDDGREIHLSGFTEDELVEQPAIELFADLGWSTANLYTETFGPNGTEGRESRQEVFLPNRLRAALQRLNPTIPSEGIEQAIEELTRDRSAMLPVAANREIWQLLRQGPPVSIKGPDGEPQPERVALIDWTKPEANDFLLASQFWIAGELYNRRADLVGFVNGIPLLFIELKAAHKSIEDAFKDNLNDNKDTIPQAFHANGFVILSNGAEAVMGASHGEFDHFVEWKRIDDEGSEGVVSLETMIRATCTKERLLDIVENFTAFEEGRGGLVKKLGKNHQYLGVNKALAKVQEIDANKGRLGVFWHTQGSGKSLSMVYFAEKVFRKLGGNWTFVLVTDRQELDDQIAKTFAATGALTKRIKDAQAQSREHLKELLTGNERYVFTLIHKFSTDRGELFPILSERDDIIVITDEAHRSQYDQLAANMRRALPKAAFIGFTGTPLMAGEERTREVFGDYVSVYNFAQSIEDGATVPLYYENRIPELQIVNEDLDEDLEQLLEDAELDPEAERRLEREFARQYHLITRDDRMERIAEDLVRHFAGRGYRGKAMYVAIDKITAVRMYDKVRKRWSPYLAEQETRLANAADEEKPALKSNLDWLKATDMAVVVSQSQNEVADMKAKGLEIKPHRERLVREDMDEKFKDPNDPLRLVFVCAMWITGFDVPTCSTIYLDKPMKNHSLMQTIARANRRAPGKTAGLIVDYVRVFGNLQKALAIYAPPTEGSGDQPIKDKVALIEELRGELAEAKVFCSEFGVEPAAILAVGKFERVAKIKAATEALIAPEERRKQYLQRADKCVRLYKAIMPDDAAAEFIRDVAALQVVAERIRALLGKPDLSAITGQIEQLLDSSISGVTITAPIREDGDTEGLFDLSTIDFDKLRKVLGLDNKKTSAEKLRVSAQQKVRAMAAANPTRLELVERLEKMIEEYNTGTYEAEAWLKRLIEFIKQLDEEERRTSREGLSEEELAVFDLLTRPTPKLTRAQEIEAKRLAKSLLATLNRDRLVQNWRIKAQTRAAVRTTIREVLNELPEEPYPKDLWDQKVDLTYLYVFEHFPGPGLSGGAGATVH